MTTLSIVIPTLNEEHSLPRTLTHLRALDPAPDEIVIADGGSNDATIRIAAEMGGAMADEAGAQSASQTASQTAPQTMGQIPIRILACPQPGRGPQINAGVGAAMGDIVCILHADSELPRDAIALMRAAMRDDRLALSSFLPRLVGEGGTRWGSSLHNVAKVWYAPLIGRPLAFARGVRLLFGDHAMFFRRADFAAIGGCDPRLAIMEDADLCLKFARLGRVRPLWRWVRTSDRRIAQLGSVRANIIYLKVCLLWAMGARESLGDHYPEIR